MNHQQFRKERRRFYDPTPRAQVAVATIGNTKLVMKDGLAHIALLALGFEPIMECEPDAVLLRAPAGFEVAGHDELVAALRNTEAFIAGFEDADCEDTLATVESILIDARAALAKAGA